MKKTALLLVIALLLSLTLTSCKLVDSIKDIKNLVIEPEGVDDLMERIDDKMDNMHSYRIYGEARIKFDVEGVELSGSVNMQSVVIGAPEDEDFYTYNSTESVILVSGNIQQENEKIIAYSDGKMYVKNSTNENSSMVYSEISGEDFYDYYTDNSSDIEFSYDRIYEKQMKKNEDGMWELSLWSFDKEYLDELLEDLEFTEDTLGVSLEDISVTIKTDKKFRVTSITLDFKIYNEEEPGITMTMKYSDYDSAEKVEIDETKYKEVSDARILGKIDTYLREAIEEPNGSFTLEIYQRRFYKDSYGYGTSAWYEETDRVSYSNKKNGTFYYNIGADINGQTVNIEYNLGSQTVTAGGQSQKAEQSEMEARAFIASLMDPSDFDPSRVIEITENEDGTYRIDMETTQYNEYMQIMISLGDSCYDYDFYVVVDMDGEEIISMQTHVNLIGRLYDYSIDSTVTFD